MKRRSVIFLVIALIAAPAVLTGFTASPARAAIGPKMVQVTLPGFWPACVVITGAKKVLILNTHVGVIYNKFLLCSGKRGRIRNLIHMRKPPVPRPPGRLHKHHWHHAYYKIGGGQPRGVIAITKATFSLFGNMRTSRVCIRARGASLEHGFWGAYCNAT